LKIIEDAPDKYLEWLLEQDWFCEKFADKVALIEKELSYRDEFNSHIRTYEEDVVVHIMGEQGFCFALLRLCQVHGFRCMHSTTERKKVELPDGSFRMEFGFVQFRDYYPNPNEKWYSGLGYITPDPTEFNQDPHEGGGSW